MPSASRVPFAAAVALLASLAFTAIAPRAAHSRATRRTSSVAPIDWTQVDRAMGKPGAMQDGDVYKFALPRTDLEVNVDGLPIKPALALGSWVAFKQTGTDTAMAMGDLVLRDDEVIAVLAQLRDAGIEQTALHNHLLHESPRIMYMHVRAVGSPVKIATAIHSGLSLTKTPFTAGAPPQSSTPPFDTAALAAGLGRSGKLNAGVYQVSVPRAEAIREGGLELPPAMGVATAINIQPTTFGKAAATGDFVLTATEVNPVIVALTQNGIAVTAVHSHMLNEEPHLFFLHFWGVDDASQLARGLRAALDKTNSRR